MNKDTIENFNAILSALAGSKGVIIDTHNGQRKERKATGIAALVKGDSVKPVLLSNVEYFSLNLVELEEDGTVILSDESVGGTVNLAKFGGDLRKALLAYNEEQPKLVYSTGVVDNVHLFQYGEKGESFFDLTLDINGPEIVVFNSGRNIPKGPVNYTDHHGKTHTCAEALLSSKHHDLVSTNSGTSAVVPAPLVSLEERFKRVNTLCKTLRIYYSIACDFDDDSVLIFVDENKIGNSAPLHEALETFEGWLKAKIA